jgi:RimJ/RimL family protein N-acetyltransferase
MPQFIDGQIEAFDKGAVLGYDIIYKGQFAGAIDLHNLSAEHRRCEIGYWLDKNYTGKGIASRCTAKIAEYAFNEIDMHRVLIQAASQNKASCAVAERLEFAFEGTLRDNELLDGKYYDTNVYAKLNPLHINGQ